MAGMKTILLEAVIALQKVLDADGTVEQVLELLDHTSGFPTSERETR